MILERDIAILVRALRPNAKAVKQGFACRDGAWSIRDGEEVIAVSHMGRRVAWLKALANLRNSTGSEISQ